ncbi:MAG: hypothetical protein HYX60_05935 [Legionella longbeachae]|nr:hypothetical protein [Legionella longbeachae]
MEPVGIALICAAVFGSVVVLAAFIRQLLISRDKLLNDEAQSRALNQEVNELGRMRMQMQDEQRFDSHYQVLGTNKEAIKYIDLKIEEILHKKSELVERYANVMVKESESIVKGEISIENKAACNRLRKEIDNEIEFYNTELKQLQIRRGVLWKTHTDFQTYLLKQEKTRNDNLDGVYKQHSALLEKVYLRHIDDTEIVAVKGIEASTMTFKDMFMVPIQFLMQYFGVTPGISLIQTRIENASRVEVKQAESEINTSKPEPNKEEEKEASQDEEDNADPTEEYEDNPKVKKFSTMFG